MHILTAFWMQLETNGLFLFLTVLTGDQRSVSTVVVLKLKPVLQNFFRSSFLNPNFVEQTLNSDSPQLVQFFINIVVGILQSAVFFSISFGESGHLVFKI